MIAAAVCPTLSIKAVLIYQIAMKCGIHCPQKISSCFDDP